MRITLMEERCCLLKCKVELGDILSKLIFINKWDICKTSDILFLLINLFWESPGESEKNKAASAFEEFIVMWEESEMKHFLE